VDIAVTAANEAHEPTAVMISVYPAEILSASEVVLEPLHRPETSGCLLLIETATDLRDATAAVALAVSRSDAIVAATCHFQASGVMPDGTTPAQAAYALQEAGASLVGANCGTIPEDMGTVAVEMRAGTRLPILCQPNAGLPQQQLGRWLYDVDPARFAGAAALLFAAGASIIGGCCGTTPAHIAAVRRLLFHPQRRE
jgi:5-methyltetrahydrofolate--homocysteine methyltransferase